MFMALNVWGGHNASIGCGYRRLTTRPWVGLPVSVRRIAHALFDAAVVTTVGNGSSTKFWTDRWIQRETVVGFASQP